MPPEEVAQILEIRKTTLDGMLALQKKQDEDMRAIYMKRIEVEPDREPWSENIMSDWVLPFFELEWRHSLVSCNVWSMHWKL